jgi:hypothetical protein
MKRIVLLLLVLFNIQLVFSVPDSSFIDFHPLQVGNYWEYQLEILDHFEATQEYSYFSIEVIGDTLMQNGKSYSKIIKETIPPSSKNTLYLERIDSTNSNIYRYAEEKDFLIDT